MMKRIFAAVALLCALAGSLWAQNSSTFGNITTGQASCGGANCVYYQLPPDTPYVLVTIAGTWAGTINFQSIAAPNATYSNLNSIAWTNVATQTANGNWSVATGGATFLVIQASAWTSGTAAVSMTASQTGSPMNNPVFPGTVTATGLRAPNGGSSTDVWLTNGRIGTNNAVSPGGGYAIPAFGASNPSDIGPSNIATDATGNNLNVPGSLNGLQLSGQTANHFGDSITFGYNASTPANDYVSLTDAHEGWTQNNCAHSGDTLDNMMSVMYSGGAYDSYNAGVLLTLAINAAGSGWAVNDTFTIAGGTGGIGMVTAAPGGVPTAISLVSGGTNYTSATAAAATAVGPSTGTGLTINTTADTGRTNICTYTQTLNAPNTILIGANDGCGGTQHEPSWPIELQTAAAYALTPNPSYKWQANDTRLSLGSVVTIGTNPANGDTITINGTVVTFVTSGATGNQVNIGVSAAATATALQVMAQASADVNLSLSYYVNAASGTVTVTNLAAGTTPTLATSVSGKISFNASTWTSSAQLKAPNEMQTSAAGSTQLLTVIGGVFYYAYTGTALSNAYVTIVNTSTGITVAQFSPALLTGDPNKPQMQRINFGSDGKRVLLVTVTFPGGAGTFLSDWMASNEAQQSTSLWMLAMYPNVSITEFYLPTCENAVNSAVNNLYQDGLNIFKADLRPACYNASLTPTCNTNFDGIHPTDPSFAVIAGVLERSIDNSKFQIAPTPQVAGYGPPTPQSSTQNTVIDSSGAAFTDYTAGITLAANAQKTVTVNLPTGSTFPTQYNFEVTYTSAASIRFNSAYKISGNAASGSNSTICLVGTTVTSSTSPEVVINSGTGVTPSQITFAVVNTDATFQSNGQLTFRFYNTNQTPILPGAVSIGSSSAIVSSAQPSTCTAPYISMPFLLPGASAAQLTTPYNFGASRLYITNRAGATTLTEGEVAIDSTVHQFHYWGGADFIIPGVPVASPIAAGEGIGMIQSGSQYQLGDIGRAVGSFGVTSQSAQTGSIAATTFLTPTVNARYVIEVVVHTTTAGSAGTVTCTATLGSYTITSTATASLTATNSQVSCELPVLWLTGDGGMKYATTVVGNVGGQYTVQVWAVKQ